MTSLGEQTWFRSGDRSLEGWVHRPDDGRVVGAVVIAGPFAHEALVTYRALRVLAVEAAKRGFVAVRFSWSGTGDSEPAPTDSPLSEAWQQDLAAAADLARAASAVESVDAIGVRFGAAVVAASDAPFRTRVLWAPLGGRAFLRMQSSLLTMHLRAGFPRAGHGVELCGFTLEDDAAASLRTLPDPRSAGAADGSLVIIDDDQQASDELFGREPSAARVPPRSIATTLDALDPGSVRGLPRWDAERELLSVDAASGTRLRQTLVAIGPDRLPGVLTEPVDGRPATAAALFIPFASDPKGADRIDRATSVRLAGGGVPTLRADRHGIGDAADPAELIDGPALIERGAADVALFATWLADRTGRPVIGIGLCSGAWLIARAAVLAPFERLIMVNNQAWSPSRRYYERQRRILSKISNDPTGGDDEDTAAGVEGLGKRLKRLVRSGAPYLVRHRLFSALNIDEVVETLLEPVPERTSISLLFGTDDFGHWQSSRGPSSLARLIRRGRRIDVEYDPRTDHALMSQASFEAYLELLDREFDLRPRPITADATKV